MNHEAMFIPDILSPPEGISGRLLIIYSHPSPSHTKSLRHLENPGLKSETWGTRICCELQTWATRPPAFVMNLRYGPPS